MFFIVWALLLLSSSIGTSAQCRDGWTHHMESCYLFTNEVSSWGEAVAICRAFKAQLAEIETDQEYQFIVGQLYAHHSRQRVWLGATDIETEAEWRWLNSGNLLVNPNWGPHEPAGQTNENCLALYHKDSNAYYIDMACSSQEAFICEMIFDKDNNIVG